MHWLEAGVDLQFIKDLLGHADLTTTEVYAQINTDMKRKYWRRCIPKKTTQISLVEDECGLMDCKGFRRNLISNNPTI
jgi:hypothetical protein